MKNDTDAGVSLVGSVLALFAILAFLAALVLMAYITLTVSVVFGVVLLAGMGGLFFGPGGWKPFILIGMILILCLMVVLL